MDFRMIKKLALTVAILTAMTLFMFIFVTGILWMANTFGPTVLPVILFLGFFGYLAYQVAETILER